MKRLSFAALLASAALAAAAQTPAPKVGYVNTNRILTQSVPAIRAQEKLNAEFGPRDRELAKAAEQLKKMQDDIEKNAVTMSESQRRNREREFGELNRDFQRKQREFREDLNQRRNDELSRVTEQANRVINQIAEQEKFDLILQDVVYFSPRMDITDKVIKALEGKPAAK